MAEPPARQTPVCKPENAEGRACFLRTRRQSVQTRTASVQTGRADARTQRTNGEYKKDTPQRPGLCLQNKKRRVATWLHETLYYLCVRNEKYRKYGKTHETEICHNLPAAVVVPGHDSGFCISAPSPRRPHLHAPEHNEPPSGDLRQRLRIALQRACARKGTKQGQGQDTAQHTAADGRHNALHCTTDNILHTREDSRAPQHAAADTALHARADAAGPACGVTRRGTTGRALTPEQHHF